MKKKGILIQAVRQYRRRNFHQVIKLLQPQLFAYRQNSLFFELLAYSNLFLSDFAGSHAYIRRLLDIDPHSVNGRLAMALLCCKKLERGEAAAIWLTVLDDVPGNRYAKRGLNTLRRINSNDDLYLLFESDRWQHLLPGGKSPFFSRKTTVTITFFLLVFIVGTSIYSLWLNRSQNNPAEQSGNRSKLTYLSSQIDFDNALTISGDSIYNFNPQQLQQLTAAIDDNFFNHRDNLTQRDINRLLLSNASEEVKNRAEVLLPHLDQPNFITIEDNFSYQQVIKEPQLYQDCYVVWKGKAANQIVNEDRITFDLLVGYQDNLIVEGTVPVIFSTAVRVFIDQPIELLGQVIPDGNGRLYLRGISIHLIAE